MGIIVRFDRNMHLTPKQIDRGIDRIKKEYINIGLMPKKTRKTQRTLNRLVKLKMLEGLLEGMRKF